MEQLKLDQTYPRKIMSETLRGIIHRTPHAIACSLASILMASASTAFGQNAVPDAGRILESTSTPPLVPPSSIGTKVVPDIATPEKGKSQEGLRVTVKRFVLKGVTVFPDEVLLDLLKPYLGRQLSFDDLNQTTKVITDHYRRHGYFLASAYLVPQDVGQGEVVIQVLEGKLSQIRVVPNQTLRLNEAVAQRYLDAALVPGQPVKEDELERALLLIQDLPGIKTRAEVRPGANLGETAIDLGLLEGPLVTGNLGVDNFTNRYTGSVRILGGLNVNDIEGLGGQVSLTGITSGADFSYGRLGYIIPVGGYGTRAGVAYSDLDYSLGGGFRPLRAEGDARVAQFFVTHPLIRSRYTNLTLTAGHDDKRYSNRANNVNTSQKDVRNILIGLGLDAQDSWFGGGISSAGLDFTFGDVDLSRNAAFQGADAAGPRTEGQFNKTNYRFGRLQSLGGNWSMLINASGQLASKNLESAEKLSLGGPGRVRAYPTGEASGDEGFILTIEGRYRLPAINSELSAFYDFGSITRNRNSYPGSVTVGGAPNRYSLEGIGLGVNWKPTVGTLVQLQVASKIGSNPGRNASGQDVDGYSSRTRGWFQVSSQF